MVKIHEGWQLCSYVAYNQEHTSRRARRFSRKISEILGKYLRMAIPFLPCNCCTQICSQAKMLEHLAAITVTMNIEMDVAQTILDESAAITSLSDR